jgi:hypothetical protein
MVFPILEFPVELFGLVSEADVPLHDLFRARLVTRKLQFPNRKFHEECQPV